MANAKRKRKIRRRFAVRRSPIHGRGVFALQLIPKGTRIVEYKGELITDAEADRRYSKIHEHSPHTMLFSVDDGLVIDATRRGNSARWINHSCAPNCEIEEENRRLEAGGGAATAMGALLTGSPEMVKVVRTVERVASADVSVMLLGASGTGKELLARAVHAWL